MPYRITYPMELEDYIRSIEKESGMERDETTVKLAAAVTARVNKAYYCGKHGRPRPLTFKGGDPLQDEFLQTLYRHEEAAYQAGIKAMLRPLTLDEKRKLLDFIDNLRK